MRAASLEHSRRARVRPKNKRAQQAESEEQPGSAGAGDEPGARGTGPVSPGLQRERPAGGGPCLISCPAAPAAPRGHSLPPAPMLENTRPHRVPYTGAARTPVPVKPARVLPAPLGAAWGRGPPGSSPPRCICSPGNHLFSVAKRTRTYRASPRSLVSAPQYLPDRFGQPEGPWGWSSVRSVPAARWTRCRALCTGRGREWGVPGSRASCTRQP